MEDILNSSKIEIQSGEKTPDMWNDIVKEIKEDKPGIIESTLQWIFDYKLHFAVGFAVVFIVLSFSISQWNTRGLISISKAEKLANKIDKDVYEAQKAYEKVIDKLEENCRFSELTTENDLAQAYFDKLHLLDQMIMVCKSSLEGNPYNSTIHQQLIFAYNEKIKVYKELNGLNEGELS